jgi:hypothetical protein
MSELDSIAIQPKRRKEQRNTPHNYGQGKIMELKGRYMGEISTNTCLSRSREKTDHEYE